MTAESYHYRDHFEDIESLVESRGIFWKNGSLRNSSRRPIQVGRIFQEWLGNYRKPIPPLTPDQFEELVLEITQEESQPEGEFHETPEAFVDAALQACPIKYEVSLRAWIGPGGRPCTYKQLEDAVMLLYYQYRLTREGLKWVDRHVQLALQERYDSCEADERIKLRTVIPFDPAMEEDSRSCLRWVLGDVLQAEEPDLCTEVFRHWLWQVKRYAMGMSVAEPIMVNLRGLQGCGKTQFVRMLANCRGLLRGYFLPTTLDAVLDGRESHRWAGSLVCFFDELVVNRSGDDREMGRMVAGLKQLLTAETITWRELGKHTINNIPRTFSAISASNGPLADIIRDETGMRRFFEIVIQREEPMSYTEHGEVFGDLDQELGSHPDGAMDPLVIWQGIDERRPQGYIVGEVKEQVRAVQATYRKKDNLEWILETAESDLQRPVLQEMDPLLYEAIQGLQTAAEIQAHLRSLPDNPYRLVTAFQVEKSFRDWMREYIPEMVRYIPSRENLISSLEQKGYPAIRLKNRVFFVIWETYTSFDGLQDESPI